MIEVVYSGHRLYGGDECHFMDDWKGSKYDVRA